MTNMIKASYAPFAVLTVAGEDYRLRINTHSAIEAEKKLGCSISRAWLRLDEVTVQTTLLHAALQGCNAGISFDDAADLRDQYITEGGSIEGLADIFKEVFICSGFMKREPQKAEAAPTAAETPES